MPPLACSSMCNPLLLFSLLPWYLPRLICWALGCLFCSSYSQTQPQREHLKMEEDKRFGVLQCAVDSEYVKKRYGGYFSLYSNLFSDNAAAETWDVYSVCQGQFPEEKELRKYHGFIITGSCSDAHGNDPWILRLCNLIQNLYSLRIRLLGICFGHQVLCRALGGKTGRSPAGWDIGLTKVKISNGLRQRYPKIQIPNEIKIIEIHQDQVYRMPNGAQVLASSDKTGIEMFAMGDNVLGIQGHPEYSSDILFNLTDRLLHKNVIDEKAVEVAKASLCNASPDVEAWQKICKSFFSRKGKGKGEAGMIMNEKTKVQVKKEGQSMVCLGSGFKFAVYNGFPRKTVF